MDEGGKAPLPGLGRSAPAHDDPLRTHALGDGTQRGFVGGQPASVGDVVARPLPQCEAMMVLVHAQEHGPVGIAVAALEAQDARGELLPAGEVADLESESAQLCDAFIAHFSLRELRWGCIDLQWCDARNECSASHGFGARYIAGEK